MEGDRSRPPLCVVEAYGFTMELNVTLLSVTFKSVADLIGLCWASKVILPETPLKVILAMASFTLVASSEPASLMDWSSRLAAS